MEDESFRLRAGRIRPWHRVLADVVAAGVYLVLWAGAGPLPAGALPAAGEVFVPVAALAMASRRLRPVAALTAVQVAACVLVLTGHGTFGFLAQAYVMYVVPLRLPAAGAVAALCAVTATTAGSLALGPPPGADGEPFDTRMVTVTTVSAAAWAIGRAVRQHRAYTEGLREQADRRARARVAEERIRIARELHDIIAHGMSLIAVQAGMASHVLGKRPEEAARALASIEETSRAALGDLRRLVGILRDEDRVDPALEPAPGLHHLDRLVTSAARAGVRLDVRVRGTPRPLPPGVDMAAYRVLQEAVTNVVKHARAGAGRVALTYEDDAIRLEVTDDGQGARGGVGDGHGLVGMRERVSLYGGEFEAGPLPGRGFRVAARLPGGTA